MEAGEILYNMIDLTPKEQKRFLKGLLKDAKETKRAHDLTYFLNKNALPISLISGIATCVGVVTIGALAGARGVIESVPVWAKSLHAAAGITSVGGILGMISTVTKVNNAEKRAENAKILSESAKRDIELIKRMQKKIEMSSKENDCEVY